MTTPNGPSQAVTSDQRLAANTDPWATWATSSDEPSPSPVITDHGDHLTIDWPDGRGNHVLVTPAVVEGWVDQVNRLRAAPPAVGDTRTVTTTLTEAVDRLVTRHGGVHPAMEAICAHRWRLVEDPRHTLAQLAALDVLSSVVTAHGHDIDTAVGDLLTTLLADERPAGWDHDAWTGGRP